MRHWMLALLVLFACACAQAAPMRPAVRLLGTFPEGSDIAVPIGETVYVRVAYDAPQPTRIWVRPYYQGKEVSAGSGASLEYQGKGELLGFFFMHEPGHVDELRVTAGDGSRGGTPEIARWPVRIASYSNAPPLPPEPAWLAELRAADQKATDEAMRAYRDRPISAGQVGIFGVFMLVFAGLGILGMGWPVWAVWRWRDKWRWWALLPLAVIGFVVLRIVVDTGRDPTSHNLLPFEIIMAGGSSVLMMAVIAAMRWRERKRGAE